MCCVLPTTGVSRSRHFRISGSLTWSFWYPKGGKDPSVVDAYRPITLLSTLEKTLEKLVVTRLQRHICSDRILSPRQFGFVTGRGTEDAIYCALSEIESLRGLYNRLYRTVSYLPTTAITNIPPLILTVSAAGKYRRRVRGWSAGKVNTVIPVIDGRPQQKPENPTESCSWEEMTAVVGQQPQG